MPDAVGPSGAGDGRHPPRLVVVGSANLDVVLRLSELPRPGETVVAAEMLRAAGGKGANQAVAASRLGAEVRLVAAVGDDAAGAELLEALSLEGLGGDVRVIPGVPSGSAFVMVEAGGGNTVTIVPGANSCLEADLASERQRLEAADALLLQLEIPLAVNVAAARAASAAGAEVMLNAAPAAPPGGLAELFGLCEVLVVNEVEAAFLSGVDPAGQDFGPCATRLLDLGPRLVVVTLGAAGSLAVTAGSSLVVEAPAVSAIDTVGAGDAFCAGLAVARAEGLPIGDALRFANACGALATTKRGAQPSFARREAVLGLLAQEAPGEARGRR